MRSTFRNFAAELNYMVTETIALEIIHQWDEESLGMLYRHFYKALAGYALQLVGEEAVAEDMVQEVMAATWQQRRTFRTEGLLKAYLFNAVRNECINHLRHAQVQQRHITNIEQHYREMHTTADGELTEHKEELYRQLFMAIDHMPQKQREVFLQIMEGKKNNEIANALQVSINTVKKMRQRGMDRLRQMLNPEAIALLISLAGGQ